MAADDKVGECGIGVGSGFGSAVGTLGTGGGRGTSGSSVTGGRVWPVRKGTGWGGRDRGHPGSRPFDCGPLGGIGIWECRVQGTFCFQCEAYNPSMRIDRLDRIDFLLDYLLRHRFVLLSSKKQNPAATNSTIAISSPDKTTAAK